MPGFGSLAPDTSSEDDLLNRYYDPGTGMPAPGPDTYQPRRPWVMEPDLLETQTGRRNLPPGMRENEIGGVVSEDTGEPVPVVRRPSVLPIAPTPEGPRFVKPKIADLLPYLMGSPAGEGAGSVGKFVAAKKPCCNPVSEAAALAEERPKRRPAAASIRSAANGATSQAPEQMRPPDLASSGPVNGGASLPDVGPPALGPGPQVSAGVPWANRMVENWGKAPPAPAEDPVIAGKGYSTIRQSDISRGIGLGMSFSGGGLGTRVPKPAIEAPAILPRQVPNAEDIAAVRQAAVEYGRKGWPTASREVFHTNPESYAETESLVPQVSIKDRLPGPLPGEKLPNMGRVEPIIGSTEEIANRIAERLDPMVRRGDETLKFYHTGPVIRGLERYGDLTTPQAAQFMRDWAGQGAATSPRTQTPPNLRNASWLQYLRATGNPLTPERYEAEGNVPGFPMMGMHVDLADKFARGVENPWINPKPTVFRENWSGNLPDVTGDTHNIRSTLYEFDKVHPGQLPPQWFNTPEAYAKYRREGFEALDPGDIKDTLGSTTVKGVKRQSEYLPMTQPWYRAAQKVGIAPAEAQSGGWFSYGPITGLQSPPKTIPNLLNDQIEATAKAMGVPHEKAVHWWAKRMIPLASLAGMLAPRDERQ